MVVVLVVLRNDDVVWMLVLVVTEFVSSALLRDVEWPERFVHGGGHKMVEKKGES